MATKIDKAALVVAAKKIAKLRVETVGGDKSRPAETVQSCLNRGFNDLGSPDGISYILRHAIKYYIGALPTTHGAADEDQVAYWKGAYERMAARNKELSSLLSPSQASVEVVCQATILGEDSYGRPVHLSKKEAEVAIAAYLAHSTAAFIRMQPPAGETIRSTQDGSMEGASVTGQSPVDAPSTTPPTA